MKTLKLIIAILLTAASTSDACVATSNKSWSKAEFKKHFKKSNRSVASLQKFADGNPNPLEEAKLANLLLEHRPQNPNEKVVLSIPAAIEIGTEKPFGDGQVNSKMTFGKYWKESGFPVIGIQTTSSKGVTERKYVFHPSLNIKDYIETKTDSGWVKVQPKGWEDSFYFSFETEIVSVPKLLEDFPEKSRTFTGGRLAPNPAKIAKGIKAEAIESMDLGAEYNQEAWKDPNVHGLYPDKDKGIKTAVGKVATWGIVDGPHQGSFKHLYTCFQKRQYADEKEFGVPTGAGWHYIGDEVERILNTLENESIPVALGRTHGFQKASYGLTQTITATWLQTDEAFTTKNSQFHWYVNPYEADVCTEIWVPWKK